MQPSEVLYKKAVLKNFAIFTGEQLCWSLFLVKLQAEKRLQHRCFPMHIANFVTTSIFKNIYERLFLIILLLRNLFGFGRIYSKSISFTAFLTYLKFFFLVQHVFHANICRWELLLLLLMTYLKRTIETKVFD